MRQLAFEFPDDEGATVSVMGTVALTPAELEAIRLHALEAELVNLDVEQRQRRFAELAARERRAAVESRRR